MTQLNTPYPATAYLKGFLRSRGVESVQVDAALELILRLFSEVGLKLIREEVLSLPLNKRSLKCRAFVDHFEEYARTIEPVVRYLQGKDPSLALRVVSREYLPEGPRFEALQAWEAQGDPSLNWAFGMMGVQDRAKYYASLYLDDLADVIAEGVDSKFSFSRYGEKLAASQPSFDFLTEELSRANPSLIDRILDEVVDEEYQKHQPDLVLVTAPFPGNVYGAFRIARRFKKNNPEIKTVLGGGYVNTELRSLTEPRVFDDFDYVTLDDGEKPLWCLLEGVRAQSKGESETQWVRTFVRRQGQVVYLNDSSQKDVSFREVGAPDYRGLKLDGYLSVVEMLNPMHRIWSDGRWNKITLAHGCYWRKCNFCDTSLDYIGRYEAAQADLIISRMEQVIAETGQTGFHFVDEAAPPALLKTLAEKIVEKQLTVTWWGNIRFEKSFTPELVRLLARAGCVAVTGGLEAASDRLLKKMNKGVSVDQVARVTRAFSDAGVLVHAYLMYGFPGQTIEETVDALDRVRQLFEHGCIQSAYWHRFSATIHSPVGKNPAEFGIRILPRQHKGDLFAENDLEFEDLELSFDLEQAGNALRKALYNFMHGIGLDQDVRSWFREVGFKNLKKSRVDRNLIRNALKQ